MKNLTIISVTIVLALFTSCNQVKLTNDEAKVLIIRTLNLPITFRHDVDKRPSMGSGFELDGLRKAGLITGSEYLDSRRLIEIQITEIGESSFMGENSSAYMFKTNDIVFDQITGISINKEEQTATIRFSLKAKNVTLAAYALAKTDAGFSGEKYINYSLINPLSGEFIFKKFDNGWQLLDQGKSSSDLLNQILESDINSNSRDDYSQLIKEKRDEIYAKENELQVKYAAHNDFMVFWADFKKAVANNDKQALAEMTRFPFTDFYELAYERPGLTCKTNTEFSNRFSKIFPSCAINKIANGQPIKIDSDNEVNVEQNVGAEFWLFLGGDCDGSENIIAGYVFGKYKDIYKLVGLKYLP